MSFARRVLIAALILQIVGFLREIFFAIGLDRYVAILTTMSDPTIIVATVVMVVALALLVPVWRGNRWATLATLPLMVLLLVAAVPVFAPMFGAPNSDNFAVWLTVTVIIVSALAGIVFGIVATLESFGRKAPSPALSGNHFSLAAVAVAAITGSVIGMTVLGVAVAANPQQSSVPAMTRPDALITVSMRSLRFEPADLEIAADETTAIFLVNEDAFDHAFDVDDLDLHVTVPAGQARVVTVSPGEAGHLAVYCSIPGHTESGMVGRIVAD